ncbi:Mitochondrial protein cyt-4 [Golovinomyces cichoracearum]|uniref:Mitochondrial protein cyt-4 n=1 Tax=Golovinomyces cichoracearum TaxID=62708 RepID=A0A420J108_9PEZI|nr:Mitochondrial protein cyt-4 [Golovinomyces cichoracearum]
MRHHRNIRSFICWKCLNRRYQNNSISYLRGISCRTGNFQIPQTRTFFSSLYERSSVEILSHDSHSPKEVQSFPNPNIRERLRLWESENIDLPETEDTSPYTSSPTLEKSFNSVTHPFVSHLSVKANTEEIADDDLLRTQDIEDGLEGVKRDFLIPGDLVDLRFGGNNNELAIFVQRLEIQSQYYTMSGRWLHQRGTKVNIYFPSFVHSSELDELRKHLPQKDVPADQEDALHGFEKVLPRTIGGPLLQKMKNFWTQANAVYEATASKLDESYKIVAHPTEFQYATISELGERILSGSVQRKKDGKFPDYALYALHRRIFCESAGFIPSNLRKARGEAQYEILPLQLTKEMSRVIGYVRKLHKYKLSGGKSEKPTELQTFAKKASELIQKSRKTRDFTEYGNIGPYKGNPNNELKSFRRENFSNTDQEFVRFLEVWAGLISLGTIVGCTYDSAGSSILRAIGKYNDPDTRLNRQTAWTCLKELGAIPPWQIVSQYGIRAPNTSCRLSLSPGLVSNDTDYSIDKMRNYRTDLKNTTIFCIDDAEAMELDDGLSLEATSSPDVYWVHIHIADPTSILSSHGAESRYAQARGNTVFLPGNKIPMLDHESVMKHMSLAEDRLCLTFSAKLNLRGELLDSKISPGILGNVLCITPRTFAEINKITTIPNAPIIYCVGQRTVSKSPSRKLTRKDQLSKKQHRDLEILGKIGEARTLLLQKNGAAFSIMEYDSLRVYFNPKAQPVISDKFLLQNVDPTIEIHLSGSYQDFIVGHSNTKKSYGTAMTSFMQLAGQIAAQWCSERKIPIPYRIALPQSSKHDLAEYHRQNILPFVEKNEQIPDPMISGYLSLIGPAHLSTEPAPHPALGMDAYTKVTSPLRRYLDMVVHWQINATLRQELSSNQRMIGKGRRDFLPFSKSWLNSILPHMTRLERWAKYYELCAVQEWKCQFLLRAWKYSHSKLPRPLVFVSKRIILGSRNCVFGELTCIALKALMEVPDFMNFEDIKEGDIFDVEICDLNIHSQKVTLKALRKLSLEEIPRLDQPMSLED